MNRSHIRPRSLVRSNHRSGGLPSGWARRALGLGLLGSGLVWLNIVFHHALDGGQSPFAVAAWLEHGFGAMPSGDTALALLLCGMLAAYAIRRAR